MPDGMPYYIEKGPSLRLMESALNRPKEQREQLRQRICDESLPLEKWFLDDELWNTSPARKRSDEKGVKVEEDIARQWFGYTEEGGKWVKKPPPPPAQEPTGYWIAYRGEVDRIVRRTLCWALQISLGCDEAGLDDAGKPVKGNGGRPDPWDIELFWNCPANWFEGWVISRPIAPPGLPPNPKPPTRGLVTVIFMTPAHKGSQVAKSPLAVSAKATTGARTVPSSEDDYQVVWPPPPNPPKQVPARNRRYATWVVTHRQHRLYDPSGTEIQTTNTAGGAVPGTLEKALGAVYSGYGPGGSKAEEIVVVSPSKKSGGVLENGG
jgi:hypothetical protein